jgi:voltage-gated potassium channel
VWWACVTVTTVGYGDYVPVSPTGRGIATLMLFNGVAIISVITATISSRFVSNPDKGELPVTLDDVDERLARIEAALAAMSGVSGNILPTPSPASAEPDSTQPRTGSPTTPPRRS